MGEVYRARDGRLNRDVAIKVLPADVAADSDRLARFEREAQVLASLNHPNIAHIHGVEDSSGTPALVMELVEGSTLADRIAKGPIPLDEALPIAKQIAEALEAAHEQGIIHRDLKPANVKVRPDGTVKVLDFGLAKAFEPVGVAGASATMSPTLSIHATQAGLILGTAAYMAPEQAKGQTVSRRVDLWAFGAVVYEMLTGARVFTGGDVSETLAAVLRDAPTWRALPAGTPATVCSLLRRCLQKDPRHRLADAGAARLDIEEAMAPTTGISPPPASGTAASPKWLRVLPWGLASMLALALLVLGALADRDRRPVDQPMVRLALDLPLEDASASFGPNVAISPDGTRLVYVSKNRLATRRFDQEQEASIAATDGASSPFFSPDGRWVGFFADAKLKKISVAGGAPIPLADAPSPYGGSWGPDHTIVTKLRNAAELVMIPESGGPPVPVTTLLPGEIDHSWPQVLPGGKAVLFSANTRVGGWDRATINVMSLVDRQRKTLVQGGTFGRYVASGHLVYVNGGTVFAVPLDLDTLTLRGTPVPLLDEVAYSTANGGAQIDFSTTGVVIYESGTAAEQFTVQWLDRAGGLRPLLAKPENYLSPRLSDDGTRLALSFRGDLWAIRTDRDVRTRLTYEGGSYPVWTPDSQFVVLATASKGLSWARADGSSKPQMLTESANVRWPWSFTPDGHRLAFQERSAGTGWDIWTVPIDSDGGVLRAGRPEPFLRTPFDEGKPSFSPDGQWIAYSSNAAGPEEVYVRAFPDTGGVTQVSQGGGKQPTWSHNGKELLFRDLGGRIMIATYEIVGHSLTFNTPTAWSPTHVANVNINGIYDLARDGRRIVALMPVDNMPDRARGHVIYLEHFFDELRRIAPRSTR